MRNTWNPGVGLATAHDAERDAWPAPDSSGGVDDDMTGYVQSWESIKAT
jgi:hypothetical protein